ncbi:MAG: hypothetical protein WDN08_03505 [Rhizomicrobium sp.]
MRQRTMTGAVLVSLLLAAPAAAADAGFAGTWVNAAAAEGGVARVVVTEDASRHLALHVLGKCQSQECDWGTQPGHGFSDDPASDALSSLSAEFDTGVAHRRITLQRDADAQMHFEVLTAFTDGSGRRDFAARGVLVAPGAPPVAVASEDSGGIFSGWGLGRAKPRPKAASEEAGGLLSGWGLGRAKPAASPAARPAATTAGADDGGVLSSLDIFSGWGIGRAKPKPAADGESGGLFTGWRLGPAKPREPSAPHSGN